jgi:hypothetical protein
VFGMFLLVLAVDEDIIDVDNDKDV